jgi:CheY-like chemotaxis protein
MDYIELLHTFDSDYKAQESGLRAALKIKQYATVLQRLAAIEKLLLAIHADDLAEDCKDHINQNKDISGIRHEKLEMFVNYFLSSLSMLSDEIHVLHLLRKQNIEAEKDAAPEVEVEVISPGNTPDAKKILVINKTAIFMRNFKLALEDTGHRLLGLTSGEAALMYIKTAKLDLIILDDDLPDADTVDLAKKIKETGQSAPIVLLTGNVTKEHILKVMEAGIVDFIVKPIVNNDVQEKVSKHLRLRR